MKDKQFKIYIPLVLLYLYQIFFLAHFGFSLNDPGYLFGMGWRINLGQEIYTDFLYARPPLSPYMAAFWMYVLPENSQFYYAKVVNYTYVLISSILLFKLFRVYFKNFFTPINSIITLLMINIFNANYFNHFWHTTDGIFMLVIAIYMGFKDKKPSKFSILFLSIFVLLAMMTKQSFYPSVFFVASAIYFIYGKKSTYTYVLFQSAIIIFVLAIFCFLYNEQFLAYLNFKHYESQLMPFFEAGLFIYIIGWVKTTVFLLLIIAGVHYSELLNYLKNKKYSIMYDKIASYYFTYFIYLYAFIILLSVRLIMFETESSDVMFHIPLFGGIVTIVLWIVIEFFRNNVSKKQKKQYILILLVVSISWMASLSWGNKTPILFSAPILFFFFYVNWKQKTDILIFKIAQSLLVVGFLILSTIIILQGRTGEIQDLGKYSNKLNGTFLWNKKIFLNFKKIQNKVNRCNNNYTVLPSHPHIHWINGDIPVVSLDWISNVEMLNQKERIQKELKNLDCIVIDDDYAFWNHPKFGLNINDFIDSRSKKHKQ